MPTSKVSLWRDFLMKFQCKEMNKGWLDSSTASKVTFPKRIGEITTSRWRENKGYRGEKIKVTKRVPCEFGSLAPGCCPLTLLQSEDEVCMLHVKFHLNMVENLQIEDLGNFVLYGTPNSSKPHLPTLPLRFLHVHRVIFTFKLPVVSIFWVLLVIFFV